jgi:hypothetical protein
VLVIVEIRVYQRDQSENYKNEPKLDKERVQRAEAGTKAKNRT